MDKLEQKKTDDAKQDAQSLLDSIAATSSGPTSVGDKRVREESALINGSESQPHHKQMRLEHDESAAEVGIESMPRIKVHTIETIEAACTHEVAVPHNQEYRPLVHHTGKGAKEYPFTLDPFQKEAILCLDNYQSVMVSAHTSAGKTVVAEYAIALSLKDKQRVIYTTPIKALSNQKYREMYEEFQDVGLMTGDVTINPTASCLVMTTEILRSMLYRGSEIMREVGWVVFDEIHYMRDKDRGVVWEETIILLPDSVRYVFLSATIPNARQFAEWVCFLHKQPCHVVYTEYRPVPLQHYIFPAGGDGLHLVVNEKGEFREENFNTAMSSLTSAGDAGKGDRRGRRGGTSGNSNVFKIVKLIMERGFAPVIVFSFSRKECEAYALQMLKLGFNTPKEQELVSEVYKSAINILSDTDRELPQVKELLPLLQRGVGIHHSGLLPILKETIEILFGEGLIKALFATETFSMGLNMPARTVVFTSGRKFDGKNHRWISSGEYIQMSGRAGRRGKDDRGIVILMIDQQMSASVAKEIIKGQADPLNSQFRLTYNMVLNLIRVEGINPEFMLERSFYQFQNHANLPVLYSKVKQAQAELASLNVPQELELSGYHKLKQQIAARDKQLQAIITKPQHIVPFLQAGRLIYVEIGEMEFGWGVVINFQTKAPPKDNKSITDPVYIVDALIHLAFSTNNAADAKPCPSDAVGAMEVVPIVLSGISRISSVRVKYPEDLKSRENRMHVLKIIKEVLKRFPEGLPMLDPVEDMQISGSELKEIVADLEKLHVRLAQHPLRRDTQLPQLYQKYLGKLEIETRLKNLKADLKKAKSLLQLEDLKCRKRVLRRLGYVDSQDVITAKGRVACEISAADELLLTEMLFEGLFNDLTCQQAAALLSCFVFEEKADAARLAEDLSGILRKMQEMARRIAQVSREAKIEIDEDLYVESFKPHLMDVVHAWANNISFLELCQMTEIFEGSVIRCIRRLEELLQEVCNAAKSIGNADLETKFLEAISRIKRDIVFAASLYL